jgi:hypothetical protein
LLRFLLGNLPASKLSGVSAFAFDKVCLISALNPARFAGWTALSLRARAAG